MTGKKITKMLNTSILNNAFTGVLRPKTLIMLFGFGQLSLVATGIDVLFPWTWTDKFLDLFIIYVHSDRRLEPRLVYYQMFENRTVSWELARMQCLPENTKYFLETHVFRDDYSHRHGSSPPKSYTFKIQLRQPVVFLFCREGNDLVGQNMIEVLRKTK